MRRTYVAELMEDFTSGRFDETIRNVLRKWDDVMDMRARSGERACACAYGNVRPLDLLGHGNVPYA